MRQDDLLPPSTSASALADQIAAEILASGDWIGFERYMALALYSPGLGYYSRGDRQFGAMPSSGSDFITAPQLSPLFGRALARQVLEALQATGTREVWEFGAGSGALAAQLLASLGEQIERYTIVDLSGTLRARQRQTVAEQVPQWADKLQFADRLPEQLDAVVVGNELLDAMPVVLLHFNGQHWLERGVTLAKATSATAPQFVWLDRPTPLQPPDTSGDPAGRLFPTGTVTELPRQASAFISTLASVLRRGAAFFIDYGFPEHEFYHPQRSGGTLMCHRAHRADPDPLDAPGEKDITAHVDFTAIALAGQDAGLEVLGYTSQARFLLNCGLADDLLIASNHNDFAALAAGQKLITEHEMGELFKVIGFAAAATPFSAHGFAAGDRSHTL
jgi:SAM-dependent MidA family methyltransferase